MNMQLREADVRTGEAPGARPPWWVHPILRRRMIVAGLIVLAAAGALLFWVWYTTLCGHCRQPPHPCANPCELPPRLPAPPSPRN